MKNSESKILKIEHSAFTTKKEFIDTLFDPINENMSANDAKLIASAPELLSVLQFFVEIVETLPDSEESDLRFSDLYFEAKNAIAKARGEA